MRASASARSLSLGLASIFAFAGCSPPREFVCTSDDACDLQGQEGTCQATGYCSLRDTECPSAQRYVEHASEELSGACVEPELTYPARVLADQPRAFWRMEETGTTMTLSDSTGTLAAGALNGGDPNLPGKLGSGTGFNGDNESASLGTVHTADSDSGWSWELWVNVNEEAVDDSGLLGCSNTPRWTIRSDGQVGFGMFLRSEETFVGPPPVGQLTFGAWHHLVLTVEGSITDAPVAAMYIDGVLVQSYDEFPGAVHSPWSRGDGGQTTVGNLYLNERDGLHGFQRGVDEAAAYDYVLSAEQVARHYEAAGGR